MLCVECQCDGDDGWRRRRRRMTMMMTVVTMTRILSQSQRPSKASLLVASHGLGP